MTRIIDTRDQTAYRRVVGTFASGITVVTASLGGVPAGMTCQSFVSASLEPPMIAVFLGADSRSRGAIEEAGTFCVNVLASTQENLARIFATPGLDKFRDVEIALSPGGAPILTGSMGWIECTIHSTYDVGDHRCINGEVQTLGVGEGVAPLVYFRGGYGTFLS